MPAAGFLIQRKSPAEAQRPSVTLWEAGGTSCAAASGGGQEADVFVLRTDMLNVMPLNNAVGAMVGAMAPQSVDTVLIAGKAMKRGGRLVGVDVNRIARLGDEVREWNYRNAGQPLSRV
jgi:cytosine/adenosine deaminase-related metal-dependent hydrolase